jgi:hypothetical protein
MSKKNAKNLLTNYTREQLDKAIQTQKTQLQPDLPGQQ